MPYSYDRTAFLDGPLGQVLKNYWNRLHDFEYDLDAKAIKEYDLAASYRGGEAERDAKKMMMAIDDCTKALNEISNSGGILDKLAEMERAFLKKHGTPEEYAERQRDRMFSR